MKEREIVNLESFSAGKKRGHNDDGICIGKDFVAVVDGVEHKSLIEQNGKKIKIANIITEAIEKLNNEKTPSYAKELTFDEFTTFINMYIKKYLEQNGLQEQVGKMEATAVVYSRYYNQIWIVGDCKAIYDGNIIENPLKIDDLVIRIRTKLIKALIEEGYSEAELLKKDLAIKIMEEPEAINKYIKDPKKIAELESFREKEIKDALLECGFSKERIDEENLVKKYYNPRDLQKVLKNNSNMGIYGYSVFNGERTELKNCKVVDLPNDVKRIMLFSDGFSSEVLKGCKDLGKGVRTTRKLAEIDKLSIGENEAVHSSNRYAENIGRRAIDDASAIVFAINYIEKENEKKVYSREI